VPAAYRSQDAIDFMLRPVPEGVWESTVTLRSSRLAHVRARNLRRSPIADAADVHRLALAAYQRALEPKRLVPVPGVHYDIYIAQRHADIAAAGEWFRKHLWPKKGRR